MSASAAFFMAAAKSPYSTVRCAVLSPILKSWVSLGLVSADAIKSVKLSGLSFRTLQSTTFNLLLPGRLLGSSETHRVFRAER